MTPQRRLILEVLGAVDTHPTADEVYQMVRRRLPRISLGTVYRNLQTLADCGKIQTLALSGTQRRFDAKLETHYHVRCVECGRVADVALEGFESLEEAARRASDFEIAGHRLEFLGVCPGCRVGGRVSVGEKGQ